MQQVKLSSVELTMLAMLCCLIFVACDGTPEAVTRDTLVGSYTYHSGDPESRMTDHNLDQLIIKPNGEYELVEGGSTRSLVHKTGVWTIEPGEPAHVVLDHAGYPIQIKNNEVRLLVDLDVGTWWVKTR